MLLSYANRLPPYGSWPEQWDAIFLDKDASGAATIGLGRALQDIDFVPLHIARRGGMCTFETVANGLRLKQGSLRFALCNSCCLAATFRSDRE